MNTPVKILDVLPREMIQEPYTEKARYENALRFALLVAPLGIGFATLFIIGIAVWEFLWYAGAIFFVAGIGLACGAKIVYDEFQSTRSDFDTRRENHTNVVNQAILILQQITINQTINVKNGGILNASPVPLQEERKQIESSNEVEEIAPINEIYFLALEFMRVGVQGWIDNGGKRPKPKPFSAERMTERLNIGRDKWTEVIQFLNDSKVFARADTATWTPMVKNIAQGQEVMEKYMQGIGYLKNTNKAGKVVWIKK